MPAIKATGTLAYCLTELSIVSAMARVNTTGQKASASSGRTACPQLSSGHPPYGARAGIRDVSTDYNTRPLSGLRPFVPRGG